MAAASLACVGVSKYLCRAVQASLIWRVSPCCPIAIALPVGSQEIDNIFLGRRVAPTLQWHNQPWKLSLTASNSLPHTVIYAPQAGGFVCVEPISHVPNILNARATMGTLHNAQMRVLDAGESFAGSAGFLTLKKESL